jgi:hypothetical protein
MPDNNVVVAVYNSHTEAEGAVKDLQKSGFDLRKLSIVARDYQTEEHVVGFYTTGDRVKHWGKLGAFWGGLWECCLARPSSLSRVSALFSSPAH